MSYDIALYVKVEGYGGFVEIGRPEYPSPTYNIGKILRQCTGWNYKQSDYYKCSDIIDKIETGIRELHVNPKKYKQYEPSNGYGTVSTAIRALESMRDCIYEFGERIPLECLYISW